MDQSGGSQLFGRGSNPAAADAGNRATISQTGSDNQQVIIRQNGGELGTSQANTADIRQVGSLMDGAGTLGGTVVEQNNLSIGNSATITQGAEVAGATLNTAVLRQNDDSQRNMASIVQENSGQVAELEQNDESANNQANISQLGVNGDARLTQSGLSGNNVASIKQTAKSDGVLGRIFQGTSGYYNRATVEQAGVGGVGRISQKEESANNDAMIMQGVGGMNNEATIVQTNAYAGGSAVLGAANSATITQNLTTASSTGNSAVITQGSFDPSPATSSVVVSTGNTASVAQENDANITDLIQVGVGNKAGVVQNGYSTLKGVDTGNFPNDTAGQFGTNNVLTVQQSGTAGNPNIGNVTQIGTGNVGSITQTVPIP